jgi:hypothetical protein
MSELTNMKNSSRVKRGKKVQTAVWEKGLRGGKHRREEGGAEFVHVARRNGDAGFEKERVWGTAMARGVEEKREDGADGSARGRLSSSGRKSQP